MKNLKIDKTKNLEDEWEESRRFFIDIIPRKTTSKPLIGYGCGTAKNFRSNNFIKLGVED